MHSFTFIASNCLPFDAYTLEESPLGGTETAVIRLTEALVARGHSVKVFSKHPSPKSSKVTYESLATFKEGFQTDILIGVREWMASMVGAITKRRYFWTGDSFDQSATFGIGDRRVSNALSGLICVSAWHASTLSSHSNFPIEKTHVIRNGVYLPYFAANIKRERKALIYSSTPYRGLSLLPALFSKLKEKHPDATLHIYSGYDVYGQDKHHDHAGFKKLSDELIKVPGVFLHGNVIQKTLAEKFLQSSILFYPNTFAETSCITALEAQAAGCVVLSSKLGGLIESVGDTGILIEGDPNSQAYQQAFIASADKLLSDDRLWEDLSKRSKDKIKAEYSWDHIALQFETLTAANLQPK